MAGQNESQKSNKTMIIAAMAVIIVIIILVGVYLWYSAGTNAKAVAISTTVNSSTIASQANNGSSGSVPSSPPPLPS